MRVLGIDQSMTHSAAVLLEVKGDLLFPTEEFVCKPKGRGIGRLVELRDWMANLIDVYEPELLVRERHTMRQHGAANQLAGLAAVLDLIAYDACLASDDQYATVDPGSWKKLIANKGNLAKDTAYLLKINKALDGLEIYCNDKDVQIEDDNIADATCLAIAGYVAWTLKVGGVINTIPPDRIEWLKKQKKIDAMFKYD